MLSRGMEEAGSARVTDSLVWIPSEGVVGRVISQMAYGAIVNYSVRGIEFREMMPDEDYEPLYIGGV